MTTGVGFAHMFFDFGLTFADDRIVGFACKCTIWSKLAYEKDPPRAWLCREHFIELQSLLRADYDERRILGGDI